MPPRRPNRPGNPGAAPDGGILDGSNIPVANPSLPPGFPSPIMTQPNQQIDLGVTPRPRTSQAPSYGPPGSRPPTMPIGDYETRSFNANVEDSAASNVMQFNNAVRRVSTSMEAARVDAAGRRARGEQIGEPYPGVTNEMLQDISRQYAASTEHLKTQIQGLYQRAPNGATPDRQWIQRQTDILTQEHAQAFQRSVRERHGPAGDIALQAISQQGEEPGMLGSFMNKLSSPGGLIGAIGLGALAFFGMGGMEGGMMSMIGALVGIIGGTFLGNSVGNMVSGPSAPDVPRGPSAGVSGPQTGLGVGPSGPSLSAPALTTGNLTPTPGPRPAGPQTAGGFTIE